MKVFFSIFIIVLGIVYIGYFCKTIEIYLDLGSGKSKIVTTIAGIPSTEIRENNISRFLTSRGIKYLEKWEQLHFYRGGLIKLSRNDGTNSFDLLIPQVNRWLDRKLNDDKASELEIETIIKPLIIKFMISLQQDDFKGIKEFEKFIVEEKFKAMDKELQEEKSKNENELPR